MVVDGNVSLIVENLQVTLAQQLMPHPNIIVLIDCIALTINH